MTDTLKAIETLTLERTGHEPRFDVGVRKYRQHNADDGLDFQVAIYGNGFEATRNCNRDELVAMRDWIVTVLEASS